MNSKKRKWSEPPLQDTLKSARLSYSHPGPSWSSCFLDDLEELFNDYPQQLTVFLSQRCYELGQAVQSPTLSSRTIYILIQALIAVLENARKLEEVQVILREILQPAFIARHMITFIAQLERFSYNAHGLLKVINTTIIFLHHLVSAVPEKIQDLLYLPVDMLFSKLERQRSLGFQFSWISLKQLQDLKFLVDAGFPKVQDSLSIGELISPVETADFRKISVFPTPQDIFLDPRRTLRPNIRYGRFENELSYLNIHFRLLREDFIKPLREGISACFTPKHLFSSSSKNRRGLKLYRNVQIVKLDTTPVGMKYMARFDLSFTSWQSSKSLMTGSLVCLISNDCDDVLFATVVGYDREVLLSGTVWLDLKMSHQDLSRFVFWRKCFTMVESPAFFQVYHHVLEGLQEMDPWQLPFKRHIVDCENTVFPPLYLRDSDTIIYDLSDLSPDDNVPNKSPHMNPNSRIPEQDAWLTSRDTEGDHTMAKELDLGAKLSPSLELTPGCVDEAQSKSPIASSTKSDSIYAEVQQAEVYRKLDSVDPFDSLFWCPERFPHLDKSQIEALHAALTREFVLIQGPPGTGKTFIGLKIVEILLKNHKHWRKEGSPILVVCYTNHALDQFLEGIIKFQPERVVRIGGRSRSQKLARYSLKNIQKTQLQQILTPAQRSRFHQIMEPLHRLKEEIPDCSAVLETLHRGILTEKELETEITADQMTFPKNQGHSQMLTWLKINPMSEKMVTTKESATEKFHAKASKLDCNVFQHETNERYLDDYEYDEVYETQENWVKSKFAYIVPTKPSDADSRILLQLEEDDTKSEQELTQIHSLWRMDVKDRWKLYRKWMRSYEKKLQQALVSKIEAYEEKTDARAALSLLENQVILEKALVIGMTTTGAAKYRSLLQKIKPKIVVIEEAAEVLEAHVLTTLTTSCQHLIMIGDHQQLRPKPADYTLEKKYHLDISLFERMINNKVPYVQLQCQHRMRPEISQLLVPLFYRNLQDHPSVEEYEPIRGVERSIFFIQHEEEEDSNSESESYSNKFEVSFLVSLCRYFLKQGYKEEQITILTPYTAQLLKLRYAAKNQDLENVAIKAIDDFQGEENDIILLSLVRSNRDGRIGFLKDKNRLCVAFSRAKKGFFCIGNLKMLSETSNNRLWKDIVQLLQEKKLTGEGLTLMCQNHPDHKTVVKKIKDFCQVRDGGCQQLCQIRLECGHPCKLRCHPDDKEHARYACQTKCNKILCDLNHKCPKKCFQPCGSCREKIEKVLPKCGHTAVVPCYYSVNKWICQKPCERLLECKHVCRLKCGEDCRKYLCKEMIDLNLHGLHFINTECFNQKKPHICEQACQQVLECGHRCRGTCQTCIQGRLHLGCNHKCTRVLPCTHVCQNTCIGNCPPCSRQCENKCEHSRCHKKCGASCFRCTLPCSWKCKHYTCSKACYEMCDRPRCDKPCPKHLKCKHPCVGLCGEPCPKQCRVCQKEELCEIFFGKEDEPTACFVVLKDCGHAFEVTGLDRWMDGDPAEVQSQQIQFKACPRCSKPVQNNTRYSNVIKAIRQKIEAVRRKIEGSTDEIKVKKQQLMEMLSILLPNAYTADIEINIKGATTLQKLTDVENTLNFLISLDKLAMQAATCTAERKQSLRRMILEVTHWLHCKNSPFSSQQLKECSNEIKRISYLGNIFERLSYYEMKTLIVPDDALAQVIQALELLNRHEPFKECVEGLLHNYLQKIDELLPISGVRISEAERIMIVKAMDLGKGHWYSCPQGHVYTVGECGRPMQESKCPECGDIIGGENHNPHQGNVVSNEILQRIPSVFTEN